jgi:carboxyl-terminal processing protease
LLDPHSGLVRREEFYNRPTDGRQFGSGLALEGAAALATAAWRMPPRGGFAPPVAAAGGPALVPPAGTPWVVRTVFPGGPAQRAGVRPGDRITHVNGRPTDAADAPKLAADLFPAEESEGRPAAVRLSVRRGGEALALSLVPGYFDVETVFGVSRKADNSWNFLLDRQRKIGYVRIGTLGRGTADDLDAAIETLESEGMRGLVLDLRACPGGLLDSAVEVTRCFLKSGTIASVVNRRGEIERRYGTEGSVRRVTNQVCTVPLVVLIGGETIGGGELIAGALQDNGRARLAGRRTFGKATVQAGEPLELPATDYVFRYSTGLFVRPSGKNLQRFPEFKSSDEWGIRPDPGLELPVSPSLAKQLHEWYDLQALRPGGNREALPLDDPANDPLRQLAVRELIRQSRSKDGKPWLIVRR